MTGKTFFRLVCVAIIVIAGVLFMIPSDQEIRVTARSVWSGELTTEAGSYSVEITETESEEVSSYGTIEELGSTITVSLRGIPKTGNIDRMQGFISTREMGWYDVQLNGHEILFTYGPFLTVTDRLSRALGACKNDQHLIEQFRWNNRTRQLEKVFDRMPMDPPAQELLPEDQPRPFFRTDSTRPASGGVFFLFLPNKRERHLLLF